MKLSNIIILSICIVIAFASCRQNKEVIEEEPFDANAIALIKKDLQQIVDHAISSMNEMEPDSILSYFNLENFLGYAANGIMISNLEEAHSVLGFIYDELDEVSITVTNEKYSVHCPASAIYTAEYVEKSKGKGSSSATHSRGVITIVFAKTNGSWMIVHLHMSSYPFRTAN